MLSFGEAEAGNPGNIQFREERRERKCHEICLKKQKAHRSELKLPICSFMGYKNVQTAEKKRERSTY